VGIRRNMKGFLCTHAGDSLPRAHGIVIGVALSYTVGMPTDRISVDPARMAGGLDDPFGDRERRRLRATLVRRERGLRCAREPGQGVLRQPGSAAGVHEQ